MTLIFCDVWVLDHVFIRSIEKIPHNFIEEIDAVG